MGNFIFKHRDFENLLNSYLNYDIYHLPEYLNLKTSINSNSPIYGEFNSTKYKCIIPLIKQRINNTNKYDLSSPYGYSGILTDEKLNNEEIKRILVEFDNEAKNQGYISTFIRLNPLNNFWNNLSERNIQQIHHGKTVYIFLDKELENIRSLYSKNHKRNIKYLNEKKFSITINDWKKIDLFYNIYNQTMLRHNAATRYFLPKEYFKDLIKIKKANIFFISVLDKENNYTSGGLFSLVNGLIQYLYGATADKFVKDSPSKLMIDKAIEYGKQQKAKILHLGGGYGANIKDSLFRFKSGFSKQFLNYSTIRIIHNQEEYNKLSRDKGISEEEINSMKGFFPAYRRDE